MGVEETKSINGEEDDDDEDWKGSLATPIARSTSAIEGCFRGGEPFVLREGLAVWEASVVLLRALVAVAGGEERDTAVVAAVNSPPAASARPIRIGLSRALWRDFSAKLIRYPIKYQGEFLFILFFRSLSLGYKLGI